MATLADRARTSSEVAQRVTELGREIHRLAAGHQTQIAYAGRSFIEVRAAVEPQRGAAGALKEIVTTANEVEQAAHRVTEQASTNREAVTGISDALQQVAEAAATHASSARQVTDAAEAQGASTEEMASQANTMTQAADRLLHLVEGFTV